MPCDPVTPMTMVLIHGAWNDGSRWDQVAMYLRRDGHTVYAPTLAGHGHQGDPAANATDAANGVVELLNAENLTDVVLVAHSSGGVVGTLVAQAAPERIQRIVYLSGFIPVTGENLMDLVPPGYRADFEVLDPTTGRIPVSGLAGTREVFHGGRISLEAVTAIWETTPQQSQGLFTERLNVDGFYASLREGAFRATYFAATEDYALGWDPAYFWTPRFPQRLAANGPLRYHSMVGSHQLPDTSPEELAWELYLAGRP